MNLNSGATVKITGTPDGTSNYTLITASSIGGVTPVLDAPISGYDLVVDGTSLKLNATGASGFGSWITGTFAGGATVPALQQGSNDDPDGDGVSNLVEYAIAGQDPTVANTSIGNFSSNLLSFSKRQPLAADITYAIEESTDLGIADVWAEVAAGPTYVNDGTTVSYTLPDAASKDFMRLKVVK